MADISGRRVLVVEDEALVLMLQLTAMQFLVAALVISIKRAGMVLAVFLGWFVFKERGITDRVIASLVMTVGVLIFFLTKPDSFGSAILETQGALVLALLALAVMAGALYLTRHRNAVKTMTTAEVKTTS